MIKEAYKLGAEMALKDFTQHGKWVEEDKPKVDPKQLAMGIKVELEHTNNPEMAKRIAKDHISEFSDYYTRLEAMEAAAKKYWDKKKD